MFLPEMTWKEVNELDRSTLVVVPFGEMEQHSHHLPVETDALIVEELAKRLDVACSGKLLILPTQWLGLSLHHVHFAGTQTYLAMAGDILDSIAHAGFKRIFILNVHGGNSAILEVVLAAFQFRHPCVQATFTSYWKIAGEEIASLRESPVGGMGHACELETSLVMARSRADAPATSGARRSMAAFQIHVSGHAGLLVQ